MPRTPLLLLAGLLLGEAIPLAAQVDVTIRAGTARHGAHARDPDAVDHPRFAPGDATTLAAAIGYRRGRTRLALAVRRESPDLVLRGDDAGILTPGVLTATSLSLAASRVVVGTPAVATLALEVGVSRLRWSFAGFDDPPHATWAGLGALEGALPLTRRLQGILRLEGNVGGSMFADEPLEGYRTTTPLRASLELGLRFAP
jgi:hypothetical protein